MVDVSACTHLWDIDPAAGPTSLGKCERCGAEKHFRNHFEVTRELYGLSAGDVRKVDGYFRDVTRERRQGPTRRGG